MVGPVFRLPPFTGGQGGKKAPQTLTKKKFLMFRKSQEVANQYIHASNNHIRQAGDLQGLPTMGGRVK